MHRSAKSHRPCWSGPATLLFTVLTAAGTLAQDLPSSPPPRNDIRVENRVPVPMRDGVTLYADVYRPVVEGRHPVLVSRTPYSTERFPDAYATAVYFARRGYVYVFQDVRGRHESEGRWEPFRDDLEDGYDTIEWAAVQPWSNGKVGMEGGSYLGAVQWRAAQAQPPHLVAIFPRVASTSIYHDWITVNGGWRLAFNFGWGPVRQESRIMQNPGPHTMAGGPEGVSYENVVWHLPLNEMQGLVGRHASFYDLRRLARAPGLRRLLARAQRRGALRPDHRSRAHDGRVLRYLRPGNVARIRGCPQAGRDRAGAHGQSDGDRPMGARRLP